MGVYNSYYTYCRYKVKSVENAMDKLVNAFLRIAKKSLYITFYTGKPTPSTETWLCQMAIHLPVKFTQAN